MTMLLNRGRYWLQGFNADARRVCVSSSRGGRFKKGKNSTLSTSTTRAITDKDGQPPEITTIHGLRVQKRRAVPCRHPRRGGTRQNRYSTDRRDLPSAHRHPSTPSRPRHTPQESPSQPAGRSSSARTTPGSSSCTPQHSPEPR